MGDPILQVEGIGKAFGGVNALRNVTCAVAPGTTHAIIGPNGAGKTTLFNIISGLMRPDAGRVLFAGGCDLSGIPPHRRVSLGIARIFQQTRLFGSLTVLENVQVATAYGGHGGLPGLASGAARRRAGLAAAQALLERFGLAHRRDHRPHELAFGEQRRLELVRALAARPRLLLLDEPAAGMNAGEVDQLLEWLAEVRREGQTILLVEHNMRAVMRIADRLTVLNFGQVIAEGTPAAIQSDPLVIEAYLGGKSRAAG